MAAPTWVQSSAGTQLGGAGEMGSLASVTVGNVVLLQYLADGTGGLINIGDTNSTVEALDGTDNDMTMVTGDVLASISPGTPQNVGSPTAATQSVAIGRATATTISASFNNNSGDDIYAQWHEFASVNAGTTLADVIENVTAGVFVNGVGTAAAVTDTSVQTLGADRLALNCIAVNDDNQASFASFSGETGGDWVLRASFGTATGTDGAVGLQTAAMASAGTINGGSFTMAASDAWGVIGFALIGTTADTPVPRYPAMDHGNPGFLMKAWERGKSGVWLPPKLWTPRRPALAL